MSITSTALSDDEKSDAVWGAAAIGKEINRSAQQIYYLYSVGARRRGGQDRAKNVCCFASKTSNSAAQQNRKIKPHRSKRAAVRPSCRQCGT
jgi:hypothetical protein